MAKFETITQREIKITILMSESEASKFYSDTDPETTFDRSVVAFLRELRQAIFNELYPKADRGIEAATKQINRHPNGV